MSTECLVSVFGFPSVLFWSFFIFSFSFFLSSLSFWKTALSCFAIYWGSSLNSLGVSFFSLYLTDLRRRHHHFSSHVLTCSIALSITTTPSLDLPLLPLSTLYQLISFILVPLASPSYLYASHHIPLPFPICPHRSRRTLSSNLLVVEPRRPTLLHPHASFQFPSRSSHRHCTRLQSFLFHVSSVDNLATIVFVLQPSN